jgi:hypothetical protein
MNRHIVILTTVLALTGMLVYGIGQSPPQQHRGVDQATCPPALLTLAADVAARLRQEDLWGDRATITQWSCCVRVEAERYVLPKSDETHQWSPEVVGKLPTYVSEWDVREPARSLCQERWQTPMSSLTSEEHVIYRRVSYLSMKTITGYFDENQSIHDR